MIEVTVKEVRRMYTNDELIEIGQATVWLQKQQDYDLFYVFTYNGLDAILEHYREAKRKARS